MTTAAWPCSRAPPADDERRISSCSRAGATGGPGSCPGWTVLPRLDRDRPDGGGRIRAVRRGPGFRRPGRVLPCRDGRAVRARRFGPYLSVAALHAPGGAFFRPALSLPWPAESLPACPARRAVVGGGRLRRDAGRPGAPLERHGRASCAALARRVHAGLERAPIPDEPGPAIVAGDLARHHDSRGSLPGASRVDLLSQRPVPVGLRGIYRAAPRGGRVGPGAHGVPGLKVSLGDWGLRPWARPRHSVASASVGVPALSLCAASRRERGLA